MNLTILWSKRKLLCGVAVLGFFVWLMTNPVASTAFFALCLGGVVPGTSIILSPDMMLWSVAGVLGAVFVISLFRYRTRARRQRRQQRNIPVRMVTEKPIPVLIEDDTPTLPVLQTTRANPAIRRRHTVRMMLAQAVRTSREMLIIVGAPVIRVVIRLGQLTGMAIHAAYQGIVQAVGWTAIAMYRTIRWTVIFMYRTFRASARTLRRSAVATWRWTRPRLGKIDAWLEIRTRKLESWIVARLRRHETIRTVHSGLHEYRKTVVALKPKLPVHVVRPRMSQPKSKP